MEPVIRIQILEKAVWNSYSANTLGKDMNLTVLPDLSYRQTEKSYWVV